MEQVGWVKSDDGILSLDRNNNGVIDNILELFGKQSKVGTEELREYDLGSLQDVATVNSQGVSLTEKKLVGALDGVIDSKDEIYSKLKIWQDLNQDGVSQSNELKSLSELNISAINLNNLVVRNSVDQGNLILSQGSYVKSDGVQFNACNIVMQS